MGKLTYRYVHFYDPQHIFTSSQISTILGCIYKNIIRPDNMVAGANSIPGAILASPSVPDAVVTDQNYNYDWVRDSAVTVFELIAIFRNPDFPSWTPLLREVLENYISFVNTVQSHSADVTRGYARWNLDGTPSPSWTVQNDGPALRILTHLKAIDDAGLTASIKEMAIANVTTDLRYLSKVYGDHCFNIWEEVYGSHFFTKKTIRRAFSECLRREYLSRVTAELNLEHCIADLEESLLQHVEGLDYYKSNIAADAEGKAGNDKNIDVILALLHGELNRKTEFGIGNEKSMSTLAEVVRSFILEYPLNRDDFSFNLGPNVGRYPFDTYDGDVSDSYALGDPWFISSNAVAAYFYRLATLARSNAAITKGVDRHFCDIYQRHMKSPEDVASLGDRHILTTQRHWDNCHMSEQYDRSTGFLKSVRDLTWSYATYLMAFRYYQGFRLA